MQKHKKIFVKSRNIGEQDVWLCEWCANAVCADVHHIDEKGMGGRAGADTEDNLIGLCRGCHTLAHNSLITKEELTVRLRHILDAIEKLRNRA